MDQPVYLDFLKEPIKNEEDPKKPIIIESPRETLSKFRIEPSGKRAKTLPPKDIFVVADLHGCKKDAEGSLRTFTKHLLHGEDIYMVLLGDYIHGLKEIKIEDGKEIPVGPSYPDESIEVLLKIIEFRNLLGDRFIPLIGDHELPLIFPSFQIWKYGINQSQEFARRLNEAHMKYLSQEVKKFPIAARTQNDFILTHAGSAPMVKSWEELETLELMEPFADKLAWMNDTIEGRLLMGKHERIKKGGKDSDIRVISFEDNRKFLRNVYGKALLTGHSGKASFIVDKKGNKTKYSGIPGFIFERANQAILVTTEGNGCERKRDESGQNYYGKEFCIESGNLGKAILYSDVGAGDFHTHDIELEDLSYPKVLEKLKSAVERKHSAKAFPENMVKRYEKNMPALEEELEKDDSLARILDDAAEALDRDNSRNTVELGLPDAMYLSYINKGAQRVFLENLVTNR